MNIQVLKLNISLPFFPTQFWFDFFMEILFRMREDLPQGLSGFFYAWPGRKQKKDVRLALRREAGYNNWRRLL